MAKSDGYSNRELTREMIVGTFIGSVFIVLVVFTIVVSGSRIFSGGTHPLTVRFDRVGGLRRHDSVLFRGVPIGKVKQLELNKDGVVVHLTLDERVQLREGYRIQAMSSSLLGGMQLVIDEGYGELVPPGTPLEGLSPDNVIEDIGALVRDVRGSLNSGGVLTNLEQAVADITEVTGRLRRGEGTLGKLLAADDTLYKDIEATLADIRAIVDRVEAGEGTLGKLLAADDTVYRDLADTMANLKKITGRLEAGEGTLGKLLAADDTMCRDLTDTVANLKTITGRLEAGEGTLGKLLAADDTMYRDLTDTVANLKTITGRLEAGEGTLGKLLATDDAMYRDLAETVASLKTITGRIEAGEGLLGQLMSEKSAISTEVEGLLKDGRDMIDDLREASPISTFSSIFFGVF
ncbi:MAG: MCE family protein [Lentisphaerae bacterium]|jgi:phospholipid/cholesterol/gamma-HCH transport system substrate-binding protein|nr:MCE family protein [Lentisphaerota bacterium]